MGTTILTGGTGYSEPTGSFAGSLGTERYTNAAASAQFVFSGLTPGTAYAIGFLYNENANRVTNAAWSVAGTSGSPAGTINEQATASDFASSGSSRIWLPQSFTPTGTTLTLTIAYPASPSPAGNYIDIVGAYLDVFSNVPSPTIAAGDWNTAANWRFGAVPSGANYALVAHAMTVSTATTIGDGANSTVLTVGAAGSIAVGSTSAFTIAGNAQVNQRGSVGDWLTLAAGCTLNLSASSGVTPVVTCNDYATMQFNGSSGSHCTVNGKAGAGNPGSFTGSGSYLLLATTATYTDFSYLGNSTTSSFGNVQLANAVSAAKFSFTHCAFDHCGAVGQVLSNVGEATVLFSACTWTNSLNVDSLQLYSAASPTSGSLSITGCVFDALLHFGGGTGYAISSCFVPAGISSDTGATLWSSCDGCYIGRPASGISGERVVAGAMSNNYLYSDANTTTSFALLSSIGDMTLSNNVAEYGGTGIMPLFGETEETGASVHVTLSGNLAFSSSTGSWITFLEANSNPIHSPFQNLTSATHNTVVTSGNSPVILGPATTGMIADSFLLLAANLFVNTGSSTGVYAVNNTFTGGSLAVDQMVSSGIKANCWKGFATVSGNPFSGVSGDTNLENGKPYYSPFSNANGTSLGAGDLANTDPLFSDATRCLAKWSTYKGGPGTVADALSRLQTSPALTKTDLIPYVRAGFAPTNVALKAASYSGDTSTTDAAGNAWPGTGPGLGAIGWVSAITFLPGWIKPSPTLGTGVY